ncbi:MAG: hypothetical protein WA190_01425 [Usitatibacter sp.]
MSQTITEEYRKLQQELHKNPNYGVASLEFAPYVASLMKQTGTRSLSDYGAGKQNLLRGLAAQGVKPEQYFPYDPAFPDYGQPRSADLVCCIDVLEHIEPDLVENVLAELGSITTKFGFFSVHQGPAGKVLADGRNAHLIQKPTSWWLPRMVKHFEILQLQAHQIMGHGFWVVVKPVEKSASN